MRKPEAWRVLGISAWLLLGTPSCIEAPHKDPDPGATSASGSYSEAGSAGSQAGVGDGGHDAGRAGSTMRDGGGASGGASTSDASSQLADAAANDASRRTVADAGPLPALSLAASVATLELAPVRLAASGIYPGRVTISNGGIDDLFGFGAATLATNAETLALRASVLNPDLRIIFTVCEGLYRIVAKRSSGISSLADLSGKTIALPQGTSSQYFLSKMLGLVNLTEQDVTISNQTPSGVLWLADAATIWEPGIQGVANALGADAIEFQKDDQGREVYRELFNLYATAESLADPAKRRAIVAFVRALIDASEQIRSDPSTVWSLLTGPTGSSQAELEQSWPYERFAGTLVSDLLDVLEQEEPWHAQLDGRTPRTRAQLAPLVDDSVLQEALAL